VVWTDRSGMDGDRGGIYLQRFDATGTPVGTETMVNTTTGGDQREASATGLDDGGFVVVWSDGNGRGIFAQRYDAQGVAVGGEYVVSPESSGVESHPEIVTLSDGTLLASWTAPDGFGTGLYAQRLDEQGQPVGDAVQMNERSARNQTGEGSGDQLIALSDGRAVQVWENDGEVSARIIGEAGDVVEPPDNQDPEASDDEVSTTEGVPVVIDVLGNDTDPDTGDVLSVLSLTDPENGTVALFGAGQVAYTPNEGFSGEDTFGYTVADGNGGSSSATVTVTVEAAVEENTSPTVDGPVSVSVTEDDGAFEVALLQGASDAEEDDLSVANLVLTDGDAAGVTPGESATTLDVNPFTYSALAEGETETVTYSYDVIDGQGGSTPQTATVVINGVNDAPEASDDVDATDEETAVTVSVLDNDIDLDTSDVLTVAIASQPGNGTVERNDDNTITYTPEEDFSGTDSFTYSVDDGSGQASTAIVTIEVAVRTIHQWSVKRWR